MEAGLVSLRRYWLIVLAAWACDDAPRPEQPTTDVVLTPAQPPTTQTEPATDVLVEELRIGQLDGPPEYSFGRINRLALSPDGGIFVADVFGPSVRKYDVHGRHEFDIGGPGQGPGEYETVNGLGVDESGRLVLYDAHNARLSRYGRGGDFLESAPVWNGAGVEPREFVLGPEGVVYVSAYRASGLAHPNGDIAKEWVSVEPSGATEPLWPIPDDERVGPSYVVAGLGGYYRPFVTMTLSALGPDGSIYVARNDEYKVSRRFSRGHVSEIVRDALPISVEGAERRMWENMSEYLARRSNRARSDYFPIPRVKPLIRDLVVDHDGRLWVSRYTEPVFVEYSDRERAERIQHGRPLFEWRDELRWDVFGSDDSFIGSVTLPPNTTLLAASGPLVWGVRAGEFGEGYVVRWRAGVLSGPRGISPDNHDH